MGKMHTNSHRSIKLVGLIKSNERLPETVFHSLSLSEYRFCLFPDTQIVVTKGEKFVPKFLIFVFTSWNGFVNNIGMVGRTVLSHVHVGSDHVTVVAPWYVREMSDDLSVFGVVIKIPLVFAYILIYNAATE